MKLLVFYGLDNGKRKVSRVLQFSECSGLFNMTLYVNSLREAVRVQYNCSKDGVTTLRRDEPPAGLYRLFNDVWEVVDSGDGVPLCMFCHGDADERKGKVPEALDIETLPCLDNYDLSNVEF